MDAFDKLVEKHFPKNPFHTLMEMVEEQLDGFVPKKVLKENREAPQVSIDEFYDYLPKFELTERIGEFTPESKNEAREMFVEYMSGLNEITGLEEKIKYINTFASVASAPAGDYRVSEIMTNITFLRMLSMVIEQFSPSAAGFIFEAFLAAILGGKQIVGRTEGGGLPIQDFMKYIDPKTGEGGQPVSLKLLGPETDIEGSLPNLIKFMSEDKSAAENGIEYIVATKQSDKVVEFHSFNLNGGSFVYWMSTEKQAKLGRYFDTAKLDQYLYDYGDILGALQEAQEERRDFTALKQFLVDAFESIGITKPELSIDMPDEEFIKNTGLIQSAYIKRLGLTGAQRHRKYDREKALQNADLWRDEIWPRLSKGADDAGNVALSNEELLSAEDGATAREILKARGDRLNIYVNQAVSRGSETGLNFIDYVESAIEGAKETEEEKAARMRGLGQEEEEQLRNDLGSLWAADRETWGKVLLSSLKPGVDQFIISPVKMKQTADHYGSLVIDKEKIVAIMNQYSEQLREQVIPIYTELAKLTNELNKFYLADAVEAGGKAAQHAKQLEDNVVSAVEEQ